MKIIMLQGPPASGKSTWARDKVSKCKNHVIINRDSIRRSRGEYWIPEQEDYISDIEEFEVRAAIKRKLIPIIDATNLNPKTISKWESLAKELNVELEKVEFYIPFKEALKRDLVREFPVGEKILKKFYTKYFSELYNAEVYKLDKINMSDLKPAIVIDLDGTIAYSQGRNYYEYDKAGNDSFDPRMKVLIKNWINSGIVPIFITGREITSKSVVIDWLRTNLDSTDFFDPWILLMRDKNDNRDGVIVKEELLQTVLNKYNILAAFDDDSKVIEMYQDHGIYACKVN